MIARTAPSLLQIDDRARWNDALAGLPYSHVLQSAEWGDVKSRHGWSARRLLWEDAGVPCAAALVLQRQMPRLPWSVLYVPKGPALDYARADVVDMVLKDLESTARRSRGILIKIDPDVSPDDANPEIVPLQARVTAPADPTPAASAVEEVLRRRGWRASDEQIQFRNTALLRLDMDEDDLLAAMKAKTRYNIRLAERRGVVVRRAGVADLETFYRLYAETAGRDGFIIRPFSYYRDAWTTFVDAGRAAVLIAEAEGAPLAGLILFFFAGKAWYMYGASADQDRNLMPNYLLQWEAIRLCRERGCALYDLWGAPNEAVETDPLWGVFRFKQGLGARLVRHIGAYDFPANPPLYFLFQKLLPRYRAALRRGNSRSELAG